MRKKIYFQNEFKQRKTEKKLSSNNDSKLNHQLIQACKSIQYIADLVRTKSEIETKKNDWRFISSVMDRFMLIFFFSVTSIGFYLTLFDRERD